ncbi:MAG: hypothetical protein JWQ21_3731, partial [Herminiimonas sp.]|nr:hypothetical protein [Herminiimonas sp.]
MAQKPPLKKPLPKPAGPAAARKKTVATKSSAAKPAAVKSQSPAVKAKPAAAQTKVDAVTPNGAAKPEVTSNKVQTELKPLTPPKDKLKKPKLVRDSFTMPEAEYQVLGDVKKACIKAGFEVKKSELLRVGVALIQKMDTARLKEVLASLPPL